MLARRSRLAPSDWKRARPVVGGVLAVLAVFVLVWLCSVDEESEQGSRRTKCVAELDGKPFKWTESKVCVTETVFLDIAIGENSTGRLEIGLFGDVVPKSTENFRQLCSCELAKADVSMKKLCFHNDSFHRLIPNFVIQGGSHATGHSIYGKTFREQFSDEKHSFLSHAGRGVLAWAEYPIGSQFYIVLNPGGLEYLDGNHVVFGSILSGMDVLDQMEKSPRTKEKPDPRISILNSGVIPPLAS